MRVDEDGLPRLTDCAGIAGHRAVQGFFDVAGLRSTIHPVKLSEGAGGSLKATVKQATLLATQARHVCGHVEGNVLKHKVTRPSTRPAQNVSTTDRRSLS